MVCISKAPYIQGIPGGGLQHQVLNLKKSNPRRTVPLDVYYAQQYAEEMGKKESQRENLEWVLLWFILLILIF